MVRMGKPQNVAAFASTYNSTKWLRARMCNIPEIHRQLREVYGTQHLHDRLLQDGVNCLKVASHTLSMNEGHPSMNMFTNWHLQMRTSHWTKLTLKWVFCMEVYTTWSMTICNTENVKWGEWEPCAIWFLQVWFYGKRQYHTDEEVQNARWEWLSNVRWKIFKKGAQKLLSCYENC